MNNKNVDVFDLNIELVTDSQTKCMWISLGPHLHKHLSDTWVLTTSEAFH